MTLSKEVTLKIAKQKEEKAEFGRLVFNQYCLSLNWYDKKQFPAGIFTDEYDTKGDIVAIYSEKEMIAGMRLVRDSELGFPHEKEILLKSLNLNNEMINPAMKKLLETPRKNISEITRFVGKDKRKRILTLDMLKGIYWYAVLNSVDVYFMLVDMQLFLLCQRLNIPIDPIGIPIYCEGSWTIPTIISMDKLREKNHPVDEKIWSYVTDRSNIIGEWEIS